MRDPSTRRAEFSHWFQFDENRQYVNANTIQLNSIQFYFIFQHDTTPCPPLSYFVVSKNWTQ